MRLYNTTDGPLRVDDQGHTLEGHKSDDIDSSPEVEGFLAQGLLINCDAYKVTKTTSKKSKAGTQESSDQAAPDKQER